MTDDQRTFADALADFWAHVEQSSPDASGYIEGVIAGLAGALLALGEEVADLRQQVADLAQGGE